MEQPDIALDDDFDSETVIHQEEDKENEGDAMETDEVDGKRTKVCVLILSSAYSGRISSIVF